MRKNLPFIAALLLFVLQSCSIQTETLLHKNAETTSEINIDFREMMGFMTGMMPDSAKADNNKFAELDKLPKEWMSLYDFEKKERKKMTTDPDSVRLMKKMFIKSKSDNGEMVGISIKQDHFSAKDYAFLEKAEGKDKMPFNNKIFQSWDGKTLTIDTKNFNSDDYEKIADDGSEANDDKSKMMKEMIKMDITNVIKFETKIKSVTGLHDWVQKMDDRTIKISYSSDQLSDPSLKLKNKDAQIIIVTE